MVKQTWRTHPDKGLNGAQPNGVGGALSDECPYPDSCDSNFVAYFGYKLFNVLRKIWLKAY